jgi:transcriptional regulator with XRE-family HTH domain
MTRKPVQIERLRAALKARRFPSRHQLAQAARVSHPTLSRLVSGRIRKVNATTLQRLATALQVPPEWLTGEREDLPHVPQRGALDLEGKGPSLWENPSPAMVRFSWLMQRAEAALRRDLVQWYGQEATRAYDLWGRALLSVFDELASPVTWRAAMLVPVASPIVLVSFDNEPPVQWLMQFLEPWLEGTAWLDANILRGVLAALYTSPGREWATTFDEDQLRSLERYSIGLKAFTTKSGHGSADGESTRREESTAGASGPPVAGDGHTATASSAGCLAGRRRRSTRRPGAKRNRKQS